MMMEKYKIQMEQNKPKREADGVVNKSLMNEDVDSFSLFFSVSFIFEERGKKIAKAFEESLTLLPGPWSSCRHRQPQHIFSGVVQLVYIIRVTTGRKQNFFFSLSQL